MPDAMPHVMPDVTMPPRATRTSRAAGGLLALLLLLTLGPRRASAQLFEEDHDRSAMVLARRYTAQARREVDVALARWEADWERHDVNALADEYTKDAVIVAGDSIVRGRAAIRARLERSLPHAGAPTVTVEDFLVSDDIAYVSGRLSYTVTLPGGASEVREGPFAAALRREWVADWRVRSWVGPHALPPDGPS